MTQPQSTLPETAPQNPACEPQATEAALRASEERYRSLVNSLDSSVAMFDVNGRLLLSNQMQATTSLSLNLSGLSLGAYWVRVSSDNDSMVRLVVKK